jgi:hypothetical protein
MTDDPTPIFTLLDIAMACGLIAIGVAIAGALTERQRQGLVCLLVLAVLGLTLIYITS